MQQTLKKSLCYVWAKESDLSETYEFSFAGKDLACIRSNASGERRFRLSFDAEGNRLWWGESYFLDPNDLKEKPERAKWYRASDRTKHRAAFVWHRREAKPLPPETVSYRPASAATSSKAAASSKAKAVPKILTKASAQAPSVAKSRPPAPSSRGGEEVAHRSTASSSAQPKQQSHRKTQSARALPEVILDLEEMFVIYKPPHWRCELPSKGALNDEPDTGRSRDPLLLLRWIRDKLPSIDTSLFEEDFNPALSGTGFGPLSHRIDQETSGPMLVAKTSRAQRHLKGQFHKTEVSKRYLCLVHGRVSKAAGDIDDNIRTYRTDSVTLSEVATGGEWALTSYQVVATYGPVRGAAPGGFTLVACDIKSGRTHQIRVHMQHLGHALVSDDKYLSDERLAEDRVWCPRLFLHCYRLSFRSLPGTQETVVCPLPEDLKAALLRLGAADPEGISSDTLFHETSWQRELFRPPLTQWQPATRALRRTAALLAAAPGPLSLSELAEDAELKRLLSEEDGIAAPSRSWFSRHWRFFEAVGGGEGLSVRLRPAHAVGGEGGEEQDIERRIEVVRTELEELLRQKQRAVAEEEYQRAAEIKRRMEASTAELLSLRKFLEEEEEGPAGGPPKPITGADLERERRRLELPKPEAFVQDVRDESLFPSLPSAPKRPAAKSVGPASRTGPSSKAGSAAMRAASARPSAVSISGPAAAVATSPATPAASTSARAIASASASASASAAAEEVTTVPSLCDALVAFLEKKEGGYAHMNEVNNDKALKQVMALQLPRPVLAVNKTWLKQHEEVFALLRTEEGELYVGLMQMVKAKAKSAAKALATSTAKSPAYQKVIQKTAAGEGAKPLVYEYSSAARKGDAADAAQEVSSNPVASSWQDKFLAAVNQLPKRCCSAEELLQAVPLFAEAMGARKTREQTELLIMFLEGFPSIFRIEKTGSGSERRYTIWAR